MPDWKESKEVLERSVGKIWITSVIKIMKKIYVYADWMETSPLLMGILNVIPSRNKEVFSYEYDSVAFLLPQKYDMSL